MMTRERTNSLAWRQGGRQQSAVERVFLRRCLVWLLCISVCHTGMLPSVACAQDESLTDQELRARVKDAIRDGTAYLRRQQRPDGSWPVGESAFEGYDVGIASLAILAQINCDVDVKSPTIQRGLDYLRKARLSELGQGTYEVSLMIMALCAANQLERDLPRIRNLTQILAESQVPGGPDAGLWRYELPGFTKGGIASDRSNGQFAVLALRDAANVGVRIDPVVWQRVKQQWEEGANRDGGWAYQPPNPDGSEGSPSIGSMTVAGLSTVSIVSRMVQDDSDVDADGRVDCCTPHPPHETLARGIQWMATRGRFSTRSNPGANSAWILYYLYGLERAGRLTGVRFFGEHDWYRSGSRYLVAEQHPAGNWARATRGESDPVVATSFALLFLSKGLSRIVVNKLDYSSQPGRDAPAGDWNRHHLDIPNLIDRIDAMPGWPPRLNSQVLTLSKLQDDTAVSSLNQSPILYISGRNAPVLTDQQVGWLREYVDEGGFIFGQANCSDGTFESGFKELVRRMFPDGEASLKRLQADHPIYRSQYLLSSENLELYGVDFGCRTSVVYSPEDHACYWHKWMRHPPRERSPNLGQRILRSMSLGVNVVAYATGKEPPEKLDNEAPDDDTSDRRIARGLLEIGQLRHEGGWDTAPRAVSNLLEGLRQKTGIGVSLKPRPVPISLESLSRYPMGYMHGRYGFSLSDAERNSLRDYLSRGAILLADACCGSRQFDESFRDLMHQMYPDHPLEPIPPEHVMFTETTGFDVTEVQRQQLVTRARTASLEAQVVTGPPMLEGIQIDGQYVVIYSKYDLSCALENQASLACDGYVDKDAMRLAINLVMFALDQEITVTPSDLSSEGSP